LSPRTHTVNERAVRPIVEYSERKWRFTEIPGKPGAPKIADWCVDKVDLTWAEPKHDGGTPITGYVIEKKEKLSTVWDEVLTTKVRTSECTVSVWRDINCGF